MARPTTQTKIDQAATRAEEKIKARLDELVDVLLTAATEAQQDIKCPHCGRMFKGKNVGDPAYALKLLERVAGKATEKPPETPKTAIQELLLKLNEAGKDEAKDAEAAKQAQRVEQAREALKKIKR